MKKRIMSILLIALMIMPVSMESLVQEVAADVGEVEEIEIPTSTKGNPMLGFDEDGVQRYGGDPSILVDGDTIYAYVGHDKATASAYIIPEYMCYSSQDMKEWTYEGVTMNMQDVSWANDRNSAWAGQGIKYGEKYYFYYCTWDRNAGGRQSIGVAVADEPTGPFVDIGRPIVSGSQTSPQSNDWDDIDPTVWVDKDAQGVERRYLAWGNTRAYVCELNEDMISVKDQNGDSSITMAGGDIVEMTIPRIEGKNFVEAPYFYRQQDAKGAHYGPYYMFYAAAFNESMAYCTIDDPMNGVWTAGKILMPPTATSNTNHPAVFDFQDKTYFVYHNGSLPGGSGYRRVACVEELSINEDGSIDPIPETAAGITGLTSQISNVNYGLMSHAPFVNPDDNARYPLSSIVSMSDNPEEADATWMIRPGKANKNNKSYVSIESNNKPGLYLRANLSSVVITQEVINTPRATIEAMTFRTLKGLTGTGVTFESVAHSGYYLASEANGSLKLTDDPDPASATFMIETEPEPEVLEPELTRIVARKNTTLYQVGAKLATNDITVTAYYDNNTNKVVTGYTVDTKDVRMNQAGSYRIRVSYKERDITASSNISIRVIQTEGGTPSVTPTPVVKPPVVTAPKKGSVHKVGKLNYTITKSATKGGTVSVKAPTKKTLKKIAIPATVKIKGYTFKVTAVGKKAFFKNRKLKNITLGKNIKKIGANAFKGVAPKAKFTIPRKQYKKISKLMKAKTGFVKKTMTLKKK